MTIKTLDVNEDIEILGYTFKGLDSIMKAVEVSSRIHQIIGDRYIRRETPVMPVAGIHVLRLYEPYPCFDDFDYQYENRKFSNFFFSRHPLTDEDVNRLANMPVKMNYCMIYDGMDIDVLPAVYYRGDIYDKLIIAYK